VRRTAGIFLILYAFVLFVAGTFSASSASALESGLLATVYNNFGYNGAPPLPSVSGRPEVGQMTVSRVEQNFDQSPPFGMYEDFIVRYEGYVTSSVSGTFNFMPTADDGTKLYIDDVLVQNDWRDKGGGGAVSSPVTFEAGVSKKFEMWFYENGGGAWTTLYWNIGGLWKIVPDSAFTKQAVETTTTTTAPYLNSPQNLTVVATDESTVSLSWDMPEQSNAEVERYAVFYSCDNWSSGFAISSLTTTAVVEGLDPDKSCEFKVRADNDSLPAYSGWSNLVTALTLPTTTTTTTTTTIETATTTIPETTTTTTTEAPVEETTPVETPPSQSDTESNEPVTSVPQYAPEQEAPTEEAPVEVPKDTQESADAAVEDIFDEPISNAKLADAVENLVSDAESPEELTAVVNSLLDQELTDEQFSTVIDSIFSEPLSDENFSAAIDAVFADVSELSDEQFDAAVEAVFGESLSAEQFADALDAVFEEPISDEKFDAIIDAVLDEPLSDEQFEELVGVLESDTVTEEQVAAAVDSVIENGVTEDQATELATSEKVLQSIDGDQATEIFDAVDIGAVTPEEAAQLVEAVQEAPTEVREALESEINVFQGAIDSYEPLGSNIPVSDRRSVIAAATGAVLALPTAAGGATGSSGPSGGGSGGPSGGGTNGSGSSDRKRLSGGKR
jgi:uncharacterized membrane protein YgcG